MHGAPGRPAAEPDMAEGRRPSAPRFRRSRRDAVQRVLHHTDREQRVPIRHRRLHVRGCQPGAQRHVHRTPDRQRYLDRAASEVVAPEMRLIGGQQQWVG